MAARCRNTDISPELAGQGRRIRVPSRYHVKIRNGLRLHRGPEWSHGDLREPGPFRVRPEEHLPQHREHRPDAGPYGGRHAGCRGGFGSRAADRHVRRRRGRPRLLRAPDPGARPPGGGGGLGRRLHRPDRRLPARGRRSPHRRGRLQLHGDPLPHPRRPQGAHGAAGADRRLRAARHRAGRGECRAVGRRPDRRPARDPRRRARARGAHLHRRVPGHRLAGPRR